MHNVWVRLNHNLEDHLEQTLHKRAEVLSRMVSEEMALRAQQGEHFPSFLPITRIKKRHKV